MLRSPFRLTRKTIAHRQRCRSFTPARISQRYITQVRPIAPVPLRCITVDSPSHLFLAGRQFIPTHNTSMAHALLGQVTRNGWPVWVLDAKRVEFLDFRTWPNVQIVAGSIPQQVALVRRAWELMEYRYQLIEDGKASVNDFEPLVVFLDEYAEFRSNLLEWYAQIKVKGDPTKPPDAGRGRAAWPARRAPPASTWSCPPSARTPSSWVGRPSPSTPPSPPRRDGPRWARSVPETSSTTTPAPRPS